MHRSGDPVRAPGRGTALSTAANEPGQRDAPEPGRPLRIALGSFGDAGHTFPVLALATCLRDRGHEVLVHTWHRWQPEIEAEGLQFAKAPQYDRDPETGTYLPAYEAVRRAVLDSEDDFRRFAPDVVVSDVLSNTPGLIAERLGVPSITLVPHVYPVSVPGGAPWSAGMRDPRTPMGRWFWRKVGGMMNEGYERGQREYDDLRTALGLEPVPGPMPTLSRELTIVATFPQLERERDWPEWAQITGPLLWEPPHEAVELPPGDEPLVLLAPSTQKDPEHRMLRAGLEGLASDPVRVLGTTNRRPLSGPIELGPRTRLVDWCSYSQVMAESSVVVCNGGHGTVVRALAAGCAVLVVPDDGDQRENALRVALSGAGLRLPRRWSTGSSLRLAVRRLVADPRFTARAQELAAWHRANPGDQRAAELVEQVARAATTPHPTSGGSR